MNGNYPIHLITTNMKKILITLDYGPAAQKVAEQGFALGVTLRAKIILLHVVAEPSIYTRTAYSPIMGFGGYGADMMDADITESLVAGSERFLEKTIEHLGGANSMAMSVVVGDAADVILDTIKKKDIDLVVIGSHSHRWMEDILLGNVTQKVLRESPVPVLVIPSKRKAL
jgi:nucleotide-binding universal stress UspA family protein